MAWNDDNGLLNVLLKVFRRKTRAANSLRPWPGLIRKTFRCYPAYGGKDGLEIFQQKLVGLGYRPSFEGAKKQFRTSDTNVRVEFVIAGEYPGDGEPKAVIFPAPADNTEEIEGVRTITLKKLIELKLASGISAPDRLKDLADVQELIRLKGLDAELSRELDPSVRPKYLELHQAIAQGRQRERGA